MIPEQETAVLALALSGTDWAPARSVAMEHVLSDERAVSNDESLAFLGRHTRLVSGAAGEQNH